MKWKDKKVGVIMGGFSEEREVSLKTGKAVVDALREKGYTADPIIADRDIWEKIKESRCQVAFIALHGPMGEDGAVQGLLEWMGIPYAGSGVLGSALAMNKTMSKEIFLRHGIPTASFRTLFKGDLAGMEEVRKDLSLPCVVKPASQGSTIGLSIVRRAEDLPKALASGFELDNELLLEDFIEGRLLTVGILGETALPVVEIRPKSGFYDYDAKYVKGKTDYLVPAPLPPAVARICQDVALKAHKALRCRGFSRVDLILDGKEHPVVLECNTIPGMTETSLLPMAARAAGMEFGDLLETILETVN